MPIDTKYSGKLLFQNIYYLCDSHDVEIGYLCELMYRSPSYIASARYKLTPLTLRDCLIIADYFGVEVRDLATIDLEEKDRNERANRNSERVKSTEESI